MNAFRSAIGPTKPESICPHCYRDTNGPPQDLSRVHSSVIPNSHASCDDFKDAINEALRMQENEQNYDEVKVLLLNWDANDIALKPESGSLIFDETKQLMDVFQKNYHYDAEYYLIPSDKPNVKLMEKLSGVMSDLCDRTREKKCLLIVYYNGHGSVDDGKLIWSARREWHLNHSSYPALSWYNFQRFLEDAELDVLLLLDCCHAASAITKGVSKTMEVLAGCGRESTALGPGGDSTIGSPFTHTLIRHLREQASAPKGLLVTELQTLMSLDKVLEEQSPNHVVIMGHRRPIKLMPLHSNTGMEEESETRESISVATELKALISVSFRGEVYPDVHEFVQWLNTECPGEVANIEVQSLNIEAAFDGYSSFIIFSMPISIWARLRELPGCALVGFVKSRNLLIPADGKK